MCPNFPLGACRLIGWSACLACNALTAAAQTNSPDVERERPAVIADSPDSYVDARGYVVDRTDYPFVDDPPAVGKWESVDFVGEMKDFDPATRSCKGNLSLRELALLENGRIFRPGEWTWTKGLILSRDNQTASKYVLKDIGGVPYMFLEWKSGDYTFRHTKPEYYVLRKATTDVADLEGNWSALPSDEEFDRRLPDMVARVDICNATLDDITRLFGEPAQYYIGTRGEDRSGIQPVKRADVGRYAAYVMVYPADFSIFMMDGRIGERRAASSTPGPDSSGDPAGRTANLPPPAYKSVF
jgi:hypothetical protein